MKKLYTVFLTLAGIALHGIVLKYMWQWFIIPVFSVKGLTLVQAIGLSAIVALMWKKDDKKEDEEGIYLKRISFSIAFDLVILLYGYLLQFLM